MNKQDDKLKLEDNDGFGNGDDEYDTEEDRNKAIDPEEKLKLLIEHLKGYCNDESEYDDLRKIGNAIQNGAKLTGTILCGGYTNYSYKIHLTCDDNENDYDKSLAVFAKIAFPYALWSPDTSTNYDLGRVTAEFELMNRFSEELTITRDSDDITESPIPKPYVLIDIPAPKDGASPNMKIFVAEWVAPTDEQWGNQFIEGDIDERVIDQCARTLAMINLADCDGDINQGFQDTFTTISRGFDALYFGVIDRDDDIAVAYARDVLGREKMAAILKEFNICRLKKECLVHGDAHVFNMLVERKPNPFQLTSSFGPKGDFFLCDWEMAHKGNRGRDIGNFYSFPVMSACFLAARGHKDKADAILYSLKQFWKTYKTTLVEGLHKRQTGSNVDDDTIDIDLYLTEVYHSAIAFFGYFSFLAFYCLGFMIEYNDTEGLTDAEEKIVMGVVGWIGLRSMEVGFLDASAEEVFGDRDSERDSERLSRMESFFFGMIEQEIDRLFASRKGSRRPSRRRSSILRESSRRVSDSGFGEIIRRLSKRIEE